MQALVTLYPRIAKAVGKCQFWLGANWHHPWASDGVRNRLAAAFVAEGLDPELYLRAMPWLGREQFLGFLDEMDVYLDCPGFSGYTTAWQALHRGLPIVTVEGPFMRQRLAAGLLRRIGRTDGIAANAEEYVANAVRLAEECRDPRRRAETRAAIRAAAPTADGDIGAIRALERVLIEHL